MDLVDTLQLASVWNSPVWRDSARWMYTDATHSKIE